MHGFVSMEMYSIRFEDSALAKGDGFAVTLTVVLAVLNAFTKHEQQLRRVQALLLYVLARQQLWTTAMCNFLSYVVTSFQ